MLTVGRGKRLAQYGTCDKFSGSEGRCSFLVFYCQIGEVTMDAKRTAMSERLARARATLKTTEMRKPAGGHPTSWGPMMRK